MIYRQKEHVTCHRQLYFSHEKLSYLQTNLICRPVDSSFFFCVRWKKKFFVFCFQSPYSKVHGDGVKLLTTLANPKLISEFSIQNFTATVRPAGNNTSPDGTRIHPEEPDNGIVAIITIAVSIVVILLVGAVSESKKLKKFFNSNGIFKSSRRSSCAAIGISCTAIWRRWISTIPSTAKPPKINSVWRRIYRPECIRAPSTKR